MFGQGVSMRSTNGVARNPTLIDPVVQGVELSIESGAAIRATAGDLNIGADTPTDYLNFIGILRGNGSAITNVPHVDLVGSNRMASGAYFGKYTPTETGLDATAATNYAGLFIRGISTGVEPSDFLHNVVLRNPSAWDNGYYGNSVALIWQGGPGYTNYAANRYNVTYKSSASANTGYAIDGIYGVNSASAFVAYNATDSRHAIYGYANAQGGRLTLNAGAGASGGGAVSVNYLVEGNTSTNGLQVYDGAGNMKSWLNGDGSGRFASGIYSTNNGFYNSSSLIRWTTGTGSPESAVTAPIGSIYSRIDGGTDTSLYRKESGSGNTGWVAISTGAGSSPTYDNAQAIITHTANTDAFIVYSDGEPALQVDGGSVGEFIFKNLAGTTLAQLGSSITFDNIPSGAMFRVQVNSADSSLMINNGGFVYTIGSEGFNYNGTDGFRIEDPDWVDGQLLYNANGVIKTTTGSETFSISTLVATNIYFVTNIINTGVIPCGKLTYTNLTANITLAGFSGVDLNYNCWAKLYVTNESGPATPRSVTMPAPVRTSTNSFVFDSGTVVVWVTNDVNISFDIAAWATNASAIRWSP